MKQFLKGFFIAYVGALMASNGEAQHRSLILDSLISGLPQSVSGLSPGEYKPRWSDPKAEQLFVRSMSRSFGRNIVSVLVQQDPSDPQSHLHIKIQRSKDGKTRQTVLAPLRMQGIEVVDDGVRQLTYYPDRELIFDQVSPAVNLKNTAFRARLARANYEFSEVGRARIAGRVAVQINAEPLSDELPSREYWLDLETGYPLRSISIFNGDKEKKFDTLNIQFPESFDPSTFLLSTLPNVKKVQFNEPAQLLSASVVEKHLKFRPAMPNKLPYGFTAVAMMINSSENWPSFAIRITDGIVVAMVYQWIPKASTPDPDTRTTFNVGQRNGTRMMIASDMPQEARKRILQGFLNATPKTSGQEP